MRLPIRSPFSEQVDVFKATAINDMVFDEYHVFGSDMREVPGAEDLPAQPKN